VLPSVDLLSIEQLDDLDRTNERNAHIGGLNGSLASQRDHLRSSTGSQIRARPASESAGARPSGKAKEVVQRRLSARTISTSEEIVSYRSTGET
jgi:hypothetical protein